MQDVRLVSLGLASLLALACVLFAGFVRESWRAPAALAGAPPAGTAAGAGHAPAVDAEAAWRSLCAACHDIGELGPALAPPSGREPEALAAFLLEHADATAEEARILAAWLVARRATDGR